MEFKEGERFFSLSIEPPGNKRKKVFGTILSYSQSRKKYVVEWDKTTPESHIKWANGKIARDAIFKLE